MFPLGFLSSTSFRLGRIFYWLHNHIGVDSILPVEQDRLTVSSSIVHVLITRHYEVHSIFPHRLDNNYERYHSSY